jgi:hypothetical protein
LRYATDEKEVKIRQHLAADDFLDTIADLHERLNQG